MTALWHPAKAPGSTDDPPMEPRAQALTDHYVREIRHAFEHDERSLQTEIGSSEIGWECDRRIAYKLAGRPTTNFSDPTRAIVGTGVHLWMAKKFAHVPFRYLVEYGCRYRNVPGHGDLFDFGTGTVTDWKTTKLATIRSMRKQNTVPSYYEVQVQHNAAALKLFGLKVEEVCLVFFPIDSVLDNAWTWRSDVDPRPVDAAIDRVERLRGSDPATVAAQPSRHCGYCRQYDPSSTDLTWSCPAKKGK